jgi:hypothetical protein
MNMKMKRQSAICWKTYDSIDALPPGFWNEKVARNDISRYAEFIRIMEKYAADTKFVCLVAYLDEQMVGCAYFHLSERDLVESLSFPLTTGACLIRWIRPRFLRRNVLASGTESTDGEHWWYDADFWTWQEFFIELNRHVLHHPHRPDWVVLRSYVLNGEPLPDEVRTMYSESGFAERDELLMAILTLEKGIRTETDYLKSLNRRHRYTIRKALKKKDRFGLQYEDLGCFSDYVDEIYPLYLSTWENATELEMEPVPREFFEDLSQEQALRPRIQTVRDSVGRIIAFGLTLENPHELCLWFVGMDYTVNREFSLIYHVYWLAVTRAIRAGIRRVNMGVTTYFVKQKFEPDLCSTKCFFFSRSALERLVAKRR